ETVVESGYFVLRKIINGVLQALGPVGEILDWLLSRGEDLASALWHQAVLAIRFVKNSVSEVLDWALAQVDAVFDTILKTIESVGAKLTEAIEWAEAVGEAALEKLAQATIRVGNSIGYVLSYLEKDALPDIAAIIKGALDIGYEVFHFIAWAIDRALQTLVEVVKDLLAAGATIASLLAATIAHPGDAMQNLLKALDTIGKTIEEIGDAAWSLGQDAFAQFVLSAKAVGRSIGDILIAALQAAGAALATAISVLFNTLGTYRKMTQQEIDDAKLAFGDALDYDHIYFATSDILNDVLFGVQDFLTGNPDSRAFVTDSLVNFDVGDGFQRNTMIHELTHVWQYQTKGSAYLADAVFAQATGAGVDDDAYNYGYVNDTQTISIPIDYNGTMKTLDLGQTTGEGGQDDLAAANGDFTKFNPEQQGQIIMHFFVRKVLLNRAAADYAAWVPYDQVVQAA
ncbi:MAG TPA: hypothetical protein VFE19_08625, partial [Jatrophihabitantaceae bacterium]|nr:hypothetical protein [Jatrophihabitantaceae bacterium]